ncbi:MAG: hypothetical protein ACXW3T_09280, partial [Rhodoplanes sp.]
VPVRLLPRIAVSLLPAILLDDLKSLGSMRHFRRAKNGCPRCTEILSKISAENVRLSAGFSRRFRLYAKLYLAVHTIG